MKYCRVCKTAKPESEFPKNGGGTFRPDCKKCHVKRVQQWYCKTRETRLAVDKEHYVKNRERLLEEKKTFYKENKEEVLEKGREYRKANKARVRELGRERYRDNRDKILERRKAYVSQNKEKIKVQHSVRRLKKQGHIIPSSHCWHCGEDSPEAHHPDYNKPLSIVWLCRSCHQRAHAISL